MIKDNIIKDFEKMRFINKLEKNTSSSKMLLNVSKMNYKKNEYIEKLFIYDKTEITRLKLGKNHVAYRFYDDNHIIYCEKPEKIKKRMHTRFYIQGLTSRKYTKTFNIPLDIASFDVISKNKLLLLVNEKIREEEDFKYEIDRINFVSNGGGYSYNDYTRVYIYDLEKNECKPISTKEENVQFTHVAGTTIYYTTTKISDVYSPYTAMYSYCIDTDVCEMLYKKDDCEIQCVYKVQEDVIVVASYMKNYGINENPSIYKLENEELKLYVYNDYALDNSVNSDVRYKINSKMKVYKGALYFLSTRDEKSSIYRLKDGKIELFFNDVDVIDEFIFLGKELIICGFDAQNMQEIYSYTIEAEDGVVTALDECKKLTDFSEKFEKYRENYKLDEFIFSSNGDDIKGYVIYPKDYDEMKKYPAVLCVHGGPKTIYSSNFLYEMYLLASEGYFVLYTNPHGSCGRDDKFADIRGKYGTIDYEDLMKFVDVSLEKYNSIDDKKLAVMGGSYGGYMTNHIIGMTNRFKTAITQRSISNWISFYGTSDIGYYFATDQNGCEYDTKKLWDKSPMKNVDKIKTPTLILHSDEDYRCPLEQGVQLFTRLKVNGVKTKLVIYKGENHDLSRNGKVQSRVSRLEQIVNWLRETL